MRNLNPWAFGMVFIIVGFWMVFSDRNFELLLYKEKETTAYIIEARPQINTDEGIIQIVRYTYIADGKKYTNLKRLRNKDREYIGNTLHIKYAIKNPMITEIITFNHEFNSETNRAFLSEKENGYRSIKLINGLYYSKDYADYGKLLHEDSGTYSVIADTILELKPFLDTLSIKRFVHKNRKLVDVESKAVYK